MAKVKFYEGTKADYLSLSHPRNPQALYFCNDTKEMYKGDSLFTDGVRITLKYTDLPSINEAAEGVIYYTIEDKNGYILNNDKTNWIQMIFGPVTDLEAVAQEDENKVVPTVGAVLKAIEKISEYMPTATDSDAGLVKSSSEVLVDENGEMSIGEIETAKVVGLDEKLASLEENFTWQEI